jgi:hypothetical protein
MKIEITQREIIERVAAGLRKMDIAPDYFLCLDECMDEGELLGIPLIFASPLLIHTSVEDSLTVECPYIPVYKDRKDHSMDVHYFFDGYEETPDFMRSNKNAPKVPKDLKDPNNLINNKSNN